MRQLKDINDTELLDEIRIRFDEKNASLKETEFLNKKLIDLNNQLLEQDSVKSQFLSLIKNEFNNPISSLLNLSGRLAINPENSKRAQISQMIHLEVLRLDFQIKNIIAANEIEAGETQNYITKIDFDQLLDDVQRPFMYLIEEKHLKLVFKDELGDTVINSDAHKLELILTNLLSNACEFSFPNSEVDIVYRLDDNHFILEVSDSGEGIVVPQKLEIYNRFARFSQGKTRAHTGLGLGLSIVKGMVEALDGTVDYVSEVDKRTVFTVRIPLMQNSEDSSYGANELFFDDFDDASEI